MHLQVLPKMQLSLLTTLLVEQVCVGTLTSDKIRPFNPTCLLGLFKLTSLILPDGEQQAQSSAAPKKQPAGV